MGVHRVPKTHCAKGHERTSENTRIEYIKTDKGDRPVRRCKTCQRDRLKIYMRTYIPRKDKGHAEPDQI